MRTTLAALSALLAVTGVAMAAPKAEPNAAATACVMVDPSSGKQINVDCTPTNAIHGTTVGDAAAKPRLGIDVNPWVPGI